MLQSGLKAKAILLGVGLVFYLLALKSKPLVAATFVLEGAIADDKSSIELNITVDNLNEIEIYSQEADYAKHLEIIMEEVDTKPILKAPSGEVQTERFDDFYWELLTAVKEPSGTKFKLIYSVRILNNPLAVESKPLKDVVDEKHGVKIKPLFYDPESRKSEPSSGEMIQQVFTKPAEAPKNIAVTAVHKGLLVRWAGNEKVTYTTAPEQAARSRVPSRVLLMVFPEGESNIDLDAKKVDNLKGEHQASSCHYNFTANDEPCITCDGEEPTFVTSEQNLQVGSVQLFSNQESQASAVINNLEAGKAYQLVLQYEEGTVRSQCFIMNPIETISLTEANGEAEGIPDDPRCFIATAAYGSPLHPHLKLFRWFRDRFLLPFSWGKILVKKYYQHSEPIAAKVRASSFLRSLFLVFLWPVALGLFLMQSLVSSFGPTGWLLFSGLLSFLIIVFIIFFKKRDMILNR